MKKQEYIVVCEMPDGTQQEFISFEEVEIGASFKGGKVLDCRKLKKKFVEYN